MIPSMVLAGCGSGASVPGPTDPGSSGAAAVRAGTGDAQERNAPLSPKQIVQSAESGLELVTVTRHGPRFEVTAQWGLGRRHAIVRIDGAGRREFVRWTLRRQLRLFVRSSPPGERVGLDGLLTVRAPSLQPGVRAVVGGGDGATLFPFEKVARSRDGGATWQVSTVPRVDGERGYVSGQVVLPDGRLLVLVDAWSGDRAGRLSDLHHGAWVSTGDDWSSYRPYPAWPAPLAGDGTRPSVEWMGASTEGDGAVWAATGTGALYVSADGASFREHAAR